MAGSQRGEDGLTDRQRHFAYLLALPDERGKTRRLEDAYLESHPDFTGKYPRQIAWILTKHDLVSAKIKELKEEFIEQLKFQVQEIGLTVRERRIAEMQWRYDKLKDLIYDMAEAHDGKAPGGATGLLSHTKKGAAGEIVDVYEFQGAILTEMRAIEQAVAKELGQLEDVSTVTNVAVTLTEQERADRVAAIFDEGRTRRDRSTSKPEE